MPPEHFDYIHTRVLLGCFEDFRDVIRKSFHYLKPGGYMESQEIMSTPYCDDGTMPADWPFVEWSKQLDDAVMAADRPLRIANKLKRWYTQAGFVDVQEKIFKLPLNPWPRDPHLKYIGKMNQDNLLAALGALSMAPFSRMLSWTQEEIEVCQFLVIQCPSLLPCALCGTRKRLPVSVFKKGVYADKQHHRSTSSTSGNASWIPTCIATSGYTSYGEENPYPAKRPLLQSLPPLKDANIKTESNIAFAPV